MLTRFLYSEIEDCTQDWTFAHSSFDYVHMRYLSGSIVDWDALFREAFKALRPGAYLESFETSPMARCDDGTMGKETAVWKAYEMFAEAGKLTGRSFVMAEGSQIREAMERAGFVDVEEQHFRVSFLSALFQTLQNLQALPPVEGKRWMLMMCW